MDTLEKKHRSVFNQSKHFFVAFSFIIEFVILLAGYQILTEDELTEAGIRLDNYRSEATRQPQEPQGLDNSSEHHKYPFRARDPP